MSFPVFSISIHYSRSTSSPGLSTHSPFVCTNPDVGDDGDLIVDLLECRLSTLEFEALGFDSDTITLAE